MLKDIYTNNIQPETSEETSEELNNHCSITESEEGDIIFKINVSSIPKRPRHSGTQSSPTIYINNDMEVMNAKDIRSHILMHLMYITVEAGRCLTDSEFDSICDKTLTFNLSKALPKVFGGMSLAQIKSNVKIYNEIMNKMNLDMRSYPNSATNYIRDLTINIEIDDIPFTMLMVLDAPINHRLIMYYELLMKDYLLRKIIKNMTTKFYIPNNINRARRRCGIVSTNNILNKIDAMTELHNKSGISTMFTEPEIIKYLVNKYGIVINDYPEEYRNDIISLAEVSILRDIAGDEIMNLLDMAESMMLNTSLINNGNDTEIIVNTDVRENRNNITNKIRIPLSYMIYNNINKDSIIISHLKSLLNPQIFCKVSSCLYGYINDKNEFIACNDVDKITHVILTYYSDSCISVDSINQNKVGCIISKIYECNMPDEMPFISMLMYEL